MGFLDWVKPSKRLSDVLCRTFKVKVHGVYFEIRKINPVDFIAGTKALAQFYSVYKTQGQKEQEANSTLANPEKIKEHFADVFLAAVVHPKLVRKEEDKDQGIYVHYLMSDWELAQDLYSKIMEITYGKKKLKLFTSQKTSSNLLTL